MKKFMLLLLFCLNANATLTGPDPLGGGGTVTSVTGISPVAVANNFSTPSISIPAATSSVDGYLLSSDWSIFNAKQSALGFTPVNVAGDTMLGTLVLAGDAVNPLEPVTYQQFSLAAFGIGSKGSAHAATTAADGNKTLSGSVTADGQVVPNGQIVILQFQTNPIENGPWVVAAGAWSRPANFANGLDCHGAYYAISPVGPTYGNSFRQQIDDPCVIGTNNETWDFLSNNVYAADNVGLDLTGNTFSIKPLGIVDSMVSASAALSLSKLAPLTASRAVVSDGSGVLSSSATTATELGYLSGAASNLQAQINAISANVATRTLTGTDFLEQSTGQGPWGASVNGTGASVNINNAVNLTGAAGYVTQTTGTTATGRALLGQTILNGIGLGQGASYTYSQRIHTPNLSDGTDRYTVIVGFNNSSSALGTSNVAFTYSDNVNSGNWVLNTSSGGSATTVNTSTPFVANTWTNLQFVVNDNATLVTFYIDGISVGTISTNIPTATALGVQSMIVKSLGITSRRINSDYMYLETLFTVPR